MRAGRLCMKDAFVQGPAPGQALHYRATRQGTKVPNGAPQRTAG